MYSGVSGIRVRFIPGPLAKPSTGFGQLHMRIDAYWLKYLLTARRFNQGDRGLAKMLAFYQLFAFKL